MPVKHLAIQNQIAKAIDAARDASVWLEKGDLEQAQAAVEEARAELYDANEALLDAAAADEPSDS